MKTATAQWTFSKMMLAGCTASSLIAVMTKSDLKGRLVGNTRFWSDDEAKKIIALAKSK